MEKLYNKVSQYRGGIGKMFRKNTTKIIWKDDMKVLRVNMSKLKIIIEDFPEEWKLFGGRRLIAEICNKEINPKCFPLGEKNKLIITGGTLAGYGIPMADRLSVGGKSPLTGGIKESNSGGTAIQKLSKLGIRTIIIEGLPLTDDFYILYISKEKIELINTRGYKKLGNHELVQEMIKKFYDDVSTISIGPAGEMKMSIAGVFVSDTKYHLRAAARGGMGAVMGSKGLKAIVIKNNGTYKPNISNKEEFIKARREFIKKIMNNPETGVKYPKYGTAASVQVKNNQGALATYNFTRGSFEKANLIDGDALFKLIEERKGVGQHSHGCMSGCIIKCGNIIPDKEGNFLSENLEFETLGMLGSNLGIGNLDTIAKLNYECNNIGIDTIETGAAIGIALSCGVTNFGEEKEIFKIINRDIRNGTFLGQILGSGSTITAQVFKTSRVPAVKGQSINATDPRAHKERAITLSMSTMGGDHTFGMTRSTIPPHESSGHMPIARLVHVKMAAYESLGFCQVSLVGIEFELKYAVNFINAIFDLNKDTKWLEQYGKEVILGERKFNFAAGFSEEDDKLPDFFKEEKLPPFNLVVDLPEEEYKLYWDKSFWGNS